MSKAATIVHDIIQTDPAGLLGEWLAELKASGSGADHRISESELADHGRELLRLLVPAIATGHRIDAEGGIYVIRAADGTEYRPKELPAEYRVEGMAVDVKALLNDDVATKDMVGQPIDLLEIVRRDAG